TRLPELAARHRRRGRASRPARDRACPAGRAARARDADETRRAARRRTVGAVSAVWDTTERLAVGAHVAEAGIASAPVCAARRKVRAEPRRIAGRRRTRMSEIEDR